jgi:hypothetical protein
VSELPPKVRDALYDLHQYLSDQVAPLIATDSIALLIELPPEVMAEGIQQWTLTQYRSLGAKLPLSDYLFHAVKKVFLMGDLGLLPSETLGPFLEALGPLVVGSCPEADRELLVQNLAQLGQAQSYMAAPVQMIHRQADGEGRLAAESRAAASAPFAVSARGPAEDAARQSRLMTLLLERLEREVGARGGASEELAGQVLTALASRGSSESLTEDLARLRAMGVKADMDQVFHSLAERLPGWSRPAPAGGATGSVERSGAAEAMHRLITATKDVTEATSRLHEMVRTATARFNEGDLARASAMFEVAESVVTEGRVKPQVADSLRRGHEHLDAERLRQYADAPEKAPALAPVLRFYFALGPEGVIDELQTAERRDRRRFLLRLMEIHGEPGRALAAARLAESLGEASSHEEWQLQRNLVHLMRRIPRPAAAPPEEELELLARFLDTSRAAPLLKEAVAALAQMRHERADQHLARFMARVEEALLAGSLDAEQVATLSSVLDWVVSALARSSSVLARRAAVNHGLKRDSRLGETTARLVELGGHDLSGDHASVERLLKALEQDLPRRVLGVRTRPGASLGHVLRALAGTRDEQVRAAFQRIAQEFPEEEFGQLAGRLHAGGAPSEAPATAEAPGPEQAAAEASGEDDEPAPVRPAAPLTGLSGDLELFGLPHLLTSLAASHLTGTLVLEGPQQQELAAITLRAGALVGARLGTLSGPLAVYQFLERPQPAIFRFAKKQEEAPPAGEEAHDVDAVLLEGIRRHSDLQEALALVPDRASFAATGVTPSAPPGDFNINQMTEMWELAVSGETPVELELETNADSFTVRRLLAHWLEEGALKPR